MQHKRLLNHHGFSLVQSMVALGILGIGLSSLPAMMRQITGSTVRGKAFSQALALEAALLAGLQQESTFNSVRSTMSAGNSPIGLAITFEGKEIAKVGQPLYFTGAGKSCTAFDRKECLIRVELDIRCVAGSPYALCDAAYRVLSDSQMTGGLAPLGASGAGPFGSNDYFLSIPAEFYVRNDSTTCDPATTIAVSGFNRDTGEAYCVSKPMNRCPEGTIAKGLQFIPNADGRGGRLEFACSGSFQTISCPPNYGLMSFNPATLEPGKTKSGACVFLGLNSIPWKTTPTGKSIAGTYCPANYKTVSVSCAAFGAISSPGTCYVSCNCTPGTPDPITGVLTGGGCESCPQSVAAATGSCNVTHQGDQTASCSISYPSQQCGASWDANCSMSGSCERIPAETVPAI